MKLRTLKIVGGAIAIAALSTGCELSIGNITPVGGDDAYVAEVSAEEQEILDRIAAAEAELENRNETEVIVIEDDADDSESLLTVDEKLAEGLLNIDISDEDRIAGRENEVPAATGRIQIGETFTDPETQWTMSVRDAVVMDFSRHNVMGTINHNNTMVYAYITVDGSNAVMGGMPLPQDWVIQGSNGGFRSCGTTFITANVPDERNPSLHRYPREELQNLLMADFGAEGEDVFEWYTRGEQASGWIACNISRDEWNTQFAGGDVFLTFDRPEARLLGGGRVPGFVWEHQIS